jgi:pyruvate kinase
MKRTKILATYGPAVSTPAKVGQLVAAGVNGMRVNCSHGDSKTFREAVKIIRQGTKQSPYPVGILFDISGPKLRLDRFEGEIQLQLGDRITLVTQGTDLAKRQIAVNHPAIIQSLKKGERLFIDDGRVAFRVVSVGKDRVIAEAINPGVLSSAKGINLPDTELVISTITPKDKKDIESAVKLGADLVALSFVRSGDDIIEAKQLIKKFGGHQRVIAKLEKREAIAKLEDILLLADGVMIARGDLGVELPPAELPHLQREIIRLANRHHKPVIVATQMLESMRFSPRATRAEISDVAGAVFDFVDTVMLSAETATGEYPVEAVQVMTDVIAATEKAAPTRRVALDEYLISSPQSRGIAEAVRSAIEVCPTAVICAFTTSGFTAELISTLFPPQMVVALTSDETVMRRLALRRSVYPIKATQPKSINDMRETVDLVCRVRSLARKGDRVIITGGAPFGSTTPTNFMMIHEVK